MPQRNRVVPIPEAGGGSRPVTAEVIANPVAVAATGSVNHELQGFIKGLAEFRPELNAFLARKDDEDRDAGANFALSGGSRNDANERGSSFVDGYLSGSGEAAAIRDAQEMNGKYHSEFDKENGSVNAFLGEFFDEKMKGAQNETYRKGYERVFAREAQALRQRHGLAESEGILDKARANATEIIGYVAQSRISEGRPLDEEFLTEFNSVADLNKISGPDRNDILFSTLLQYSKQGRADVWDVTKIRRGNIPGMYNIPNWKVKIDAAEAEAHHINLQNEVAAERRAKEERNEKQNVAMMEVFDRSMSGDKEGAEKRLRELTMDRTLFTRVDELKALRDITVDLKDDVFEDSLDATENDWMLKIHSRDAVMRDILMTDELNPKAKRRLMTFQRQVEQEDRRMVMDQARDAREARALKAQLKAQEREKWNNPMFKADLDYIKDSLRSGTSATDIMGLGSAADQSARAEAERLFVAWHAQNLNASPLDRRKVASQLVEDFKKAKAAREDTLSEDTLYPEIPYRTPAELNRALDAGLIDIETYKTWVPKVKAIRQQE